MFTQQQQEQNAAALEMDLKREELFTTLQQYWKPLLGFVIFLVVLTGAMQAYRWYDARVAGEQMAKMLPLLSAPATAENARALEEFAATAGDRRAAVARLYAAAKYQASGKAEDRQRVLTQIAESKAPSEIADYARALLHNDGQAQPAGDVAKDSVWQLALSEARALAETDPQKKRDAFAALADDAGAPPALRNRAAEFSGTGK